MRVFQSVADEGGFSAAARRLDMSVPTVTRLVADLEAHLGTRLLQRTTRSVSLTAAGEAYLERVRGILGDVDDAFSMAQAHTKELSGIVRVFMPPVFAEHLLAPLIAQFHAEYPKVSIEVFAEAEIEAAAEAAIGEYDITFLSAPEGYNANVIARPIVSTYGLACASPEYLRRHGTPVHPRDLAAHQVLLRRSHLTRGDLLHMHRVDNLHDEVSVVVTPVLASNHMGTVLRATLDGAGISIQPLELIACHLSSGDLCHVLPQWTRGVFTLYATLPSRKFMPARVRVFLDFLVEHTRENRVGTGAPGWVLGATG